MDSHAHYWEDNENVLFLVGLADIGQPYTCTQWGNGGINGIPVIVEDTGTIFGWLHDSWNAYPTYAVIDHTMTIRDKPWPYGGTDNLIQQLYEECEYAGLCGNTEPPIEVTPGDINFDDIINITDIVLLVNIIVGLVEPTDEEGLAADFNEDGITNVLDIIQIVNLILGTSFSQSVDWLEENFPQLEVRERLQRLGYNYE